MRWNKEYILKWKVFFVNNNDRINSNEQLLSTQHVPGTVQATRGWQRHSSSPQRTDMLVIKISIFEGAKMPEGYC